MLIEPVQQALQDIFRHPGTFVDPAGVNLQQRCSGGNFFPGIVSGKNATYADNGQLSVGLLVDVANYLGRALTYGRTANPPRFCRD